MTAKDKLESAGLFEQYVQAIDNRDRALIIRLLRRVDISLGDRTRMSLSSRSVHCAMRDPGLEKGQCHPAGGRDPG